MITSKCSNHILRNVLIGFMAAVAAMLVLCVSAGAETISVTSAESGFAIADNGDGTATVTGYTGTEANLVVPDVIDGLYVTDIGGNAFCGNAVITGVKLPDALTSIGAYAFEYCTSLVSIDIPVGVTTIGDYAFRYCNSLRTLVLPDTLTTVGSNICESCDNLRVFISNLKGVTPYHIGTEYQNSLVKFVTAEYDYTRLCNDDNGYPISADLIVKDTVTSIPNYFEFRATSITLPDTITTIGVNAFADWTGLVSIDIPDSVTTIGDSAFYNCSSLREITIPDSVTTIGDYAFYGCTSLRKITIPESVTDFGSQTLYDCYSLTSITCLAEGFKMDGGVLNDVCAERFFSSYLPQNFTTFITKDEKHTYSNGIPSRIEVLDGVTSYKSGIVYCDYVTEIILPDSLYSIEDKAFQDSDIDSISLPDSLYTIGANAFSGSTALVRVELPEDCETIGAGAFSGCTALKTAVIPDTVTSIGEDAFLNCPSLTIKGYAGSAAETYANANNIPFRAIGGAAVTSPAIGGIRMSSIELSMKIGDLRAVEAIAQPDGAVAGNVTWSTSDPEVATVDCGAISAVGMGTAVIRATVGGYSAICAVTVSHDHDADDEWISNSTSHWHECTICGDKIDYAAHTWDSGRQNIAPTESAEGEMTYTCTDCGYKRTEPIAALQHTHSAADEWTSSSTSHWHECTGCSQKLDFEAHDIIDVIDIPATSATAGVKHRECSVCGYVTETGIEIPATEPEPVTKPAVTATAGNSCVDLEWTAVNGATKYYIYSCLNGQYTGQAVVTSTSYTVSGLVNGIKYGFVVRAYIDGTLTPFTSDDIAYATPEGETEKPVVIATAGNASVDLKWTAVDGATKYYVYSYLDGKYTAQVVTADTSYTVSGLTNGTKYGFVVRAYINGALTPFASADIAYATPTE